MTSVRVIQISDTHRRANPDCVRWFMEAAREYGRYDRILDR